MAYTPDNNFVFTLDVTYVPNGDFNFSVGDVDPIGQLVATLDGATGSLVGVVPLAGSIDSTLDGLAASFAGEIEQFGDLLVVLDGLVANFAAKNLTNQGIFQATTLEDTVAGMIGNYDPNVHRFTISQTKSAWDDAYKIRTGDTCFPTQQAEPSHNKTASQQSDGTQSVTKVTMSREDGLFMSNNSHMTYQDGVLLHSDVCFVREQATFIDLNVHSTYEQASSVPNSLCAVLQQMTKVYPDKWHIPLQDSSQQQFDFLHKVYPDIGSPYDPSILVFDFPSESYTPDNDFDFTFRTHDFNATDHTFGVVRSQTHSSFRDATTHNKLKVCVIVELAKQPDRGRTPWVDLPPVLPPVDPPGGGGETIVIPEQEVYKMQNVTTTTLEDGVTTIDLGRVQLSFDADSTSWQFTADLIDLDQVALVRHNVDGSAKILHITVNSVVWHILVEKIVTNRLYGKQSISLSGRGLSALLSKPYVQSETVNFGALQTTQQIADSIIPLDWVNTWGVPVWNIPGGAYGYSDKTPLEALSEYAKDMGAMIVPSTDSKVLEFKPRYPVEPWNFALVALDYSIPESVVIGMSEEPATNFFADGVFIHGLEIGGVQAKCRRNGTAGAKLLPTVSNALMTDAVGVRALGKRLLAAQTEQPKIKSISTFMDGATVPFINVGSFIGVTIDGVETRGIVNGVTIEVGHTKVTQTLTIGESTTNTWTIFKNILPKDPLLIATLTSTDGTTSLMALVDAGVVRVRGTGTVNNKYYIRSGEIVSDAPSVTVLADIVIPI